MPLIFNAHVMFNALRLSYSMHMSCHIEWSMQVLLCVRASVCLSVYECVREGVTPIFRLFAYL